MTTEERIAWLEAELERERARADGLQEIVHALTVKKRTANAERQARFRARIGVTSTVTSNVTVTPDGFPPPLNGSPPSSKPSSPSPLSSPPSLSASQEPVQGELVSVQPAERRVRQRAPSAAEALFRKIQETREARCVEVGETVVPERWDFARQNKVIGELLKEPEEARQRFEAAWSLYLADHGERVREPAWSLSWFMSSGVRARYETRAAREGA